MVFPHLRPSYTGQGHNTCTPEYVPSYPPGHPPLWQAQQALLMGTSSPILHRPISGSPQVSTVSNFQTVSPPYTMQPNVTSSPSSG
jgi:hypothetical protein